MLKLFDSGVDLIKFEGDLNYILIGLGERDFWKFFLEGMIVGGNFVDVVSFFKVCLLYCFNFIFSLKVF